MKKLLIILFLLNVYPNYAYSTQIDADELLGIDYNTDKFFTYCTKDTNYEDVGRYFYCIGFFRGAVYGWLRTKSLQNIENCSLPSFSDFSIKFNSLFYRNQIDTEDSTIANIYKTLNTFCK